MSSKLEPTLIELAQASPQDGITAQSAATTLGRSVRGVREALQAAVAAGRMYPIAIGGVARYYGSGADYAAALQRLRATVTRHTSEEISARHTVSALLRLPSGRCVRLEAWARDGHGDALCTYVGDDEPHGQVTLTHEWITRYARLETTA